MSFPLTMQRVITKYLYGSDEVPSDLERRVRDGDLSETTALTIDVPSYMASVGRYASPLYFDVISRFLNGDLIANGIDPDEQGRRIFSLSDMFRLNGLDEKSTSYVISNYITDPSSADFAFRAFVFGNARFTLNNTVKFIVTSDGRYVQGAVALPDDDNFDFESSTRIVQMVNKRVLEPFVDPYFIGRKVLFEFSEDSKAAYTASHAREILTPSDTPSFSSQTFSTVDVALSALGSLDDYISASGVLLGELAADIEYYKDGRNLVYGNNKGNTINSHYVDGVTHYTASSPSYIISGGGDDVIYSLTQSGDIVKAGSGDDAIDASSSVSAEIHGGDGDDLIILGQNGTALGDADDDRIILRNSGTAEGGTGDDWFFVSGNGNVNLDGGDGNDAFVFMPSPKGGDDQGSA